MDTKPIKENILNTIDDLCAKFLFYDRKEDETLSMERLNQAVMNGEITVDDMVDEFRIILEATYKMGTFDGQRFPVGSRLTSIENGELIIAPEGTPENQIVGTVTSD